MFPNAFFDPALSTVPSSDQHLLSDNGSSYVSTNLAEWLDDNGMITCATRLSPLSHTANCLKAFDDGHGKLTRGSAEGWAIFFSAAGSSLALEKTSEGYQIIVALA